jgi:hypothetical protein
MGTNASGLPLPCTLKVGIAEHKAIPLLNTSTEGMSTGEWPVYSVMMLFKPAMPKIESVRAYKLRTWTRKRASETKKTALTYTFL